MLSLHDYWLAGWGGRGWGAGSAAATWSWPVDNRQGLVWFGCQQKSYLNVNCWGGERGEISVRSFNFSSIRL